MGTIRNLIKQAKIICTNGILFNDELKCQTKIFHETNDYPMPMINKIVQQELNHNQRKNRTADNNETPKKVQVIF